MPVQMTPVTFPNANGDELFGILHAPAAPQPDRPVILLLSPGVKMRVAPHRLYVKMAERFVALGFTVLRFDFYGLGDAGGGVPEPMLADFYGAVQTGRYIADTTAAMDWMQRTYGASRFLAAGLCGGALTGMLTAERDARIVGLLALSIPAILDGTNIDASLYMTGRQLASTRSRYLRKFRLWEPDVWKSWMRFFSGQSHYSLIVRIFTKALLPERRPAAAGGGAAGPAGSTAAPAAPTDNTNPHFARTLLGMVAARRPVCLIFAETDRLLGDFETKFLARHRDALAPHLTYCDMHTVAKANHIFSLTEWQQEMLDHACAWLERVVPGTADTAASGAQRPALATSHR